MSGKHHTPFILFIVIFGGILLLLSESSAVPLTVKLRPSPAVSEIQTGSNHIDFTALATGSGVEYQWTLEGPGELKVLATFYQASYKPPDSLNTKTTATIIVMVTDNSGRKAYAFYPLDILPGQDPYPITSTSRPIPWKAIGAGTLVATGAGVGIYFLVNSESEKDKSVIEITSPANSSQVNRIETVFGTTERFSSGDRVVLFVIPHGDQAYEQANRGIVDESGNWSVTNVVFGREGDIDSGQQFDIQAELRDESEQQIKASTTVTVTRR